MKCDKCGTEGETGESYTLVGSRGYISGYEGAGLVTRTQRTYSNFKCVTVFFCSRCFEEKWHRWMVGLWSLLAVALVVGVPCLFLIRVVAWLVGSGLLFIAFLMIPVGLIFGAVLAALKLRGLYRKRSYLLHTVCEKKIGWYGDDYIILLPEEFEEWQQTHR